MVKKCLAYILSHLLYHMGDVVSKPINLKYGFWLYPVYNKLMVSSYNVQTWADNKTPWLLDKQ